MLRLRGELVQPDICPVVSPDPADSKFLDCAYAVRADFLVTGNKRDFPDSPYGLTRVVNASELLEHITLEI